jgi:MFS family permease
MFAPMRVRNFRLFFGSQLLCQPGTFVQTIAQSWLVLQLTHSALMLGLVTGAQFAPVLVIGLWGGVLADRNDCRRIMQFTQALAGSIALTIGILVLTDHISLWMIFAAAAALGTLLAIDSPAKQAYVWEMVGPATIAMAFAFNMMTNNVARVIGPAIAATLISTVGTGWCFIVNAVTFFAVELVLALIRPSELYPRDRAVREPGAIRAGLVHVRDRPILALALVMISFAGALQAGITVLQPILADETFHGGIRTYAMLSLWTGIGAVIGGLLLANRLAPSRSTLIRISLLWALALSALAAAPTRQWAYASTACVGAMLLIFVVVSNAALQAHSAPHMRGRVMSLWAIAILAPAAVGGPVFGAIADGFGPRTALAVASSIAVLMAVIGGMSPVRDVSHESGPGVQARTLAE